MVSAPDLPPGRGAARPELHRHGQRGGGRGRPVGAEDPDPPPSPDPPRAHVNRQLVGAEGVLAGALARHQARLEGAAPVARVAGGPGGVGLVVHEQELRMRAHAGLAVGDVLGLVEVGRLASPGDADDRVGRIGLVAVLGQPDRQLLVLAVGREDPVERLRQARQHGEGHLVADRVLDRRRHLERVGMVGEAGGLEQPRVIRHEALAAGLVLRAAAHPGRLARVRPQPAVHAVQLADEEQWAHRAPLLDGQGPARSGLGQQVLVEAMAGGLQRRVAGVLQPAVHPRRLRQQVRGLRAQPARLVGLVPDRPHRHAREHHWRPAGAGEAVARGSASPLGGGGCTGCSSP